MLHLDVDISLDLALYFIDYDIITSSCSLSTRDHKSKCSLDVPAFDNTYALLTTNPVSSNVSMLDKIPLKTYCDPPLWVYTLPPVLLVLVLFIFSTSCFLYHFVAAGIDVVSQQEFNTISNKFQLDWVKGTAPRVKAIFIIKNRRSHKKRWNVYRTSLGSHIKIERYYHGTKICCNITSTKRLCKNKNCGACRISDSGFSRSKIRSHIPFQRFGPGFYLAPNSSKCNDYVQRAFNCSAIIVCDVYPGRKYKTKRTNSNLNGPPRGHNSIYGEAGIDLNFDEIVLSNPAAILPRYIIIY